MDKITAKILSKSTRNKSLTTAGEFSEILILEYFGCLTLSLDFDVFFDADSVSVSRPTRRRVEMRPREATYEKFVFIVDHVKLNSARSNRKKGFVFCSRLKVNRVRVWDRVRLLFEALVRVWNWIWNVKSGTSCFNQSPIASRSAALRARLLD